MNGVTTFGTYTANASGELLLDNYNGGINSNVNDRLTGGNGAGETGLGAGRNLAAAINLTGGTLQINGSSSTFVPATPVYSLENIVGTNVNNVAGGTLSWGGTGEGVTSSIRTRTARCRWNWWSAPPAVFRPPAR